MLNHVCVYNLYLKTFTRTVNIVWSCTVWGSPTKLSDDISIPVTGRLLLQVLFTAKMPITHLKVKSNKKKLPESLHPLTILQSDASNGQIHKYCLIPV